MIPDFLNWLIIENKEKDDVFEISKQYQSKTEFKKYDKEAYKKALENGWLYDMDWLTVKKYNKHSYCVYVYVDEENNVAYVGLTVDKNRRHKEHKSGYFYKRKVKSPVFEYFNSIGKDIPEPIYLEENLTSIEAQEKECYWVNEYLNKGYTKGRFFDKIWIHNDTKTKMIHKHELQKYLDNGWKKGRFSSSKEAKNMFKKGGD